MSGNMYKVPSYVVSSCAQVSIILPISFRITSLDRRNYVIVVVFCAAKLGNIGK